MIPYEFHNLPVHALAVHAAVVSVPLATLMAILFVIPRTRHWAALPMAIVGVVALACVYVARASGVHLLNYFAAELGSTWETSDLGKLIRAHEHQGNILFYMMIVFAVICVAAYLLWLHPSWMPESLRFAGVVEYIACGVLIAGAVTVAFQTYRTGEAGAKVVWNPTGDIDYNVSAPAIHVPSPR